MDIVFSNEAQKNLNRFKKINEYDVEELVEEHISDDKFQDFLKEAHGGIYSNFYDEDNDVTIFTEINHSHDELTVLGVRRGDHHLD